MSEQKTPYGDARRDTFQRETRPTPREPHGEKFRIGLMEGVFVLSVKRSRWRMRAAVVGVLALLLLLAAVVLMSTDVQARVSMLAVQSVPTVQSTPTVDATVTALNKKQLTQQVAQQQQQIAQQQRTLGNWLWSNAAALLSSLVLAIAGVFTLFRYLRDQRSEREKQREDRQAEVVKRAEERFQSAVTGLGDEKEGAQIGAAILLRTFLRPGYEQFYTQTFDLAVANLRRRGTSGVVQHQLENSTQSIATPLPLTTLDQALIVVFKEAFPLARDYEERGPESLDATGVQLDNAYLVVADLKRMRAAKASLRKANLFGAHLEGAAFMGADLSGAYLYRAILTGATLSGADLTGADLTGATLTGAHLNAVTLNGATLRGAYLTETNLRWAHLEGAHLEGAHLEGAHLEGAHLAGATLTGAEGLTKEQRAAYKAQGALVDEEPASNVS